MKRLGWKARRVLMGAGLAACLAALAWTIGPPRGALRVVVRLCVLAQRLAGTPTPCLRVEASRDGRPGYVVLRAPDRRTHLIVAPTDPVDGLEDPGLLDRAAGLYWRIALAARSDVAAAAGGAVPLAAVGLAINAPWTRSQDHLHIHAECIRPAILADLRAAARTLGRDWTPLERPLGGEPAWGRIVDAASIQDGNLFATLASLPGSEPVPGAGKALLVQDTQLDRFVLSAVRNGSGSVEAYFDAGCRSARKP